MPKLHVLVFLSLYKCLKVESCGDTIGTCTFATIKSFDYVTPSSGIWLTKSLLKRQLGAILGFCFTSAYLALKYFRKKQAVTVPFQDNSLNSP